MKKILFISAFFFSLALSAQVVRLVNTDRQKIDSLVFRNDSLAIKIQNDEKRRLYLPGGGSLSEDDQNKINNSFLPPKTLVKNTDFTLSLPDLYNNVPSDPDIGRKYVMAVNDGGKTKVKVPNIGAVDDVARFRIDEATSIFELVPDAGITLNWAGKTGSEDAVRLQGLDALGYLRKTAANTYFVSGDEGLQGFEHITNLYTSANAANPDNEVNATTGITGVTNWMPTSVSTNPAPHTGDYSIKLTHGEGISAEKHSDIQLSGLEIGKTYKVGIWVYKVSSTGDGPMTIELHSSGGWTVSTNVVNVNSGVTQGVWTYFETTGEATSTTPVIRVRTSASSTRLNASLAYDTITVQEVPE